MMNSQRSLAFVFLMMASLSSAHLGGGKSSFPDMANPQFYCGRNLARVLAMLCNDDVDKRSEGTMYSQLMAPQDSTNKEIERRISNGWKRYWSMKEVMKDKTLHIDSILAPYHKEQESQFGWPWMFLQKSRGLGLPPRGKRYIVNECCDKACSINELSSYCYSGE